MVIISTALALSQSVSTKTWMGKAQPAVLSYCPCSAWPRAQGSLQLIRDRNVPGVGGCFLLRGLQRNTRWTRLCVSGLCTPLVTFSSSFPSAFLPGCVLCGFAFHKVLTFSALSHREYFRLIPRGRSFFVQACSVSLCCSQPPFVFAAAELGVLCSSLALQSLVFKGNVLRVVKWS